MFNGHGNEDEICGHNDEVLIKAGANHELLKQRIIYSLSCSSADGLGPASVASGTIAFIGYDGEFAPGMDANCQSSPHRDKRAKLFLEPSNLLVKSIIKSNTVKESVRKAKEMMKKNLSLLRTDSAPDATFYAPFLFYNYMCLIAHGDENATLPG